LPQIKKPKQGRTNERRIKRPMNKQAKRVKGNESPRIVCFNTKLAGYKAVNPPSLFF
jgi:hypothetical protein